MGGRRRGRIEDLMGRDGGVYMRAWEVVQRWRGGV